MFWRYIDSGHPLYELDSPYRQVIFNYYEKMDAILGEVLKRASLDTDIIVLSDHGFNSFRKAVHINSWLRDNGFLYLKPGVKEGREFFEDVDWHRTKAYALGFGGIYLNMSGREYSGIVQEQEARVLKQEIYAGLKKLKDADSGGQVIKEVYFKEQVFSGPYIDQAPDLFVGFNAGYRASWQTALGAAPSLIMEDNKRKWSGDHLIDYSLVPGVFFTNKKMGLKEPSLIDIAPSVLHLYGIPKPKEMEGDALFKE